jgi:multidrug efflux pump subunit AcrA (membrane-fusion protein)
MGEVRMPSPTLDAHTRYGLVYVDLRPVSPARPGMFARGRIQLGTSPALSLPESALVLRDGSSFVFQIQPEGRVTQRKVTTGRREKGRVEILSGLDPGVPVVATGGAFLTDGDGVRVEDAVPVPELDPDTPSGGTGADPGTAESTP